MCAFAPTPAPARSSGSGSPRAAAPEQPSDTAAAAAPAAPSAPPAPAPSAPTAASAEDSSPFLGLCLRRPRATLWFLFCLLQVYVMHGAHVVRCRLRRLAPDGGMTTAEYAVGTVAACGFAALLYKVVTSGAVSSALQGLIRRALGAV